MDTTDRRATTQNELDVVDVRVDPALTDNLNQTVPVTEHQATELTQDISRPAYALEVNSPQTASPLVRSAVFKHSRNYASKGHYGTANDKPILVTRKSGRIKNHNVLLGD